MGSNPTVLIMPAKEFKSNAQKCLDAIPEKVFGPGWYIVDPVDAQTANEIIVEEVERYVQGLHKAINNLTAAVVVTLAWGVCAVLFTMYVLT